MGRRGHGPFGGEGKSWAVCYFEPVYTIKLFVLLFFLHTSSRDIHAACTYLIFSPSTNNIKKINAFIFLP